MLKELAKKYYDEDYNCAESLVHAGNEYYELGLSEHDMRMAAAFGAGMQVGDVCGALAGAACVVSARYVETRAHNHREVLRTVMEKLVAQFEEKLGSRLCREIKEVHFQEKGRCIHTVMTAAEVLEEVLAAYDKKAKAAKHEMDSK